MRRLTNKEMAKVLADYSFAESFNYPLPEIFEQNESLFKPAVELIAKEIKDDFVIINGYPFGFFLPKLDLGLKFKLGSEVRELMFFHLLEWWELRGSKFTKKQAKKMIKESFAKWAAALNKIAEEIEQIGNNSELMKKEKNHDRSTLFKTI